MRNWLVVGVVILAVGMAWAQEGTAPKEIQAATQKCDTAIKQAQDAYRKAQVEAKTQLLKEVQTQIPLAMKAGKLEDAKALDAMKTDLEAEIKFLSFKGVIVKVDAKSFTKVMPVK